MNSDGRPNPNVSPVVAEWRPWLLFAITAMLATLTWPVTGRAEGRTLGTGTLGTGPVTGTPAGTLGTGPVGQPPHASPTGLNLVSGDLTWAECLREADASSARTLPIATADSGKLDAGSGSSTSLHQPLVGDGIGPGSFRRDGSDGRLALASARVGGRMSRHSPFPRPKDLRFHDCSIQMHATVQLDVLHDFNALGLDTNQGIIREFITSDIPVGGPASDRNHRTGLSINQTFMDATVSCPSELGKLSAYARANLAKSITDSEFQVYLAHATLGWWKIGLDYSLVLNQSAYPDTLDFETSNVIPWVRYPQLSVTVPWSEFAGPDEYFITLGIEDAEMDLSLPASVVGASSVSQVPSLVSKLIYKTEAAHLEFAGLYRRLGAKGRDYRSTTNGWGLWASGWLTTWGNDSLIYGFVGGAGIGAYADDTQGLGVDAAPVSPTSPALRAIPAQGFWAGYRHWWSERTRSTFSYGYLNLDSEFDPTPDPNGTFRSSTYASANMIYSPIASVDVGLEYLYGIHEVTRSTSVDGSRYGDNHRLQFTVRWNTSYSR